MNFQSPPSSHPMDKHFCPAPPDRRAGTARVYCRASLRLVLETIDRESADSPWARDCRHACATGKAFRTRLTPARAADLRKVSERFRRLRVTSGPLVFRPRTNVKDPAPAESSVSFQRSVGFFRAASIRPATGSV